MDWRNSAVSRRQNARPRQERGPSDRAPPRCRGAPAGPARARSPPPLLRRFRGGTQQTRSTAANRRASSPRQARYCGATSDMLSCASSIRARSAQGCPNPGRARATRFNNTAAAAVRPCMPTARPSSNNASISSRSCLTRQRQIRSDRRCRSSSSSARAAFRLRKRSAASTLQPPAQRWTGSIRRGGLRAGLCRGRLAASHHVPSRRHASTISPSISGSAIHAGNSTSEAIPVTT